MSQYNERRQRRVGKPDVRIQSRQLESQRMKNQLEFRHQKEQREKIEKMRKIKWKN